MTLAYKAVNTISDYVRASGKDLLLVSDGAGWALDGVARGIARHLPLTHRAAVVRRLAPWTRGATIHFINRYAALEDGRAERLHRHNRLIVNWSHGGAVPFEHPELAAAENDLRRIAPFVDRVQVWSSLYIPVVQRLGLDPARIVLLPLGIEVDAFDGGLGRAEARRRLDVPAEAVCVGSFQRDGETAPKLVKGPDILVDLAERLQRRLPRLLVVLSGPARGWVRGELARRGIPFRYVGIVPDHALTALYRACDLYAVTAREEGGPLSLLEAMASGVPVVTTDVGIGHDLVHTGVNGARVDVDDVGSLEREAVRLLEDPDLAARMVAQATDDVRAYDWRSLVPRYVRDLYGA